MFEIEDGVLLRYEGGEEEVAIPDYYKPPNLCIYFASVWRLHHL